MTSSYQKISGLDRPHVSEMFKNVHSGERVQNTIGVSENKKLRIKKYPDTCRRGLRRIRKYLSKDKTKTLVYAFISSTIDYCNSLLYGLPEYQLNKLQRVQNMCARLICNESNKYCHITPLLVDLHWLPVKCRIEFKNLLIVFKIFKGLAPSYSSFIITPKPVSKCNLRSSSDGTLLSYPTVNEKYRSSLQTLSLQDMYGGGFGTKFGNGSYIKGNRSYLKVRGSYLE